MRTRITYVHDAEGQFEPEQASVENGSLSVRALAGARELRVTVGLDELPQEVGTAELTALYFRDSCDSNSDRLVLAATSPEAIP